MPSDFHRVVSSIKRNRTIVVLGLLKVSDNGDVFGGLTSLIRLNPEKATTEGETPSRAVLGEARTSPAEKQRP